MEGPSLGTQLGTQGGYFRNLLKANLGNFGVSRRSFEGLLVGLLAFLGFQLETQGSWLRVLLREYKGI